MAHDPLTDPTSLIAYRLAHGETDGPRAGRPCRAPRSPAASPLPGPRPTAAGAGQPRGAAPGIAAPFLGVLLAGVAVVAAFALLR